MVDVNYWVETFLSRADEWQATLAVLVVAAFVASAYSDRHDRLAVAVGAFLLPFVLVLMQLSTVRVS